MRYQCPHCGSGVDEDALLHGICPGCRKVIEMSSLERAGEDSQAPPPKEETPSEAAEKTAPPSPPGGFNGAENIKRGIVVGIITGIMVFFFYAIVDFLFFRRAAFASGWPATALGILITGTLMGTVIGVVVEKTRNRTCGIIAGAALLALLNMFLLAGAGLSPGFRVAGLFSGAFYGAIIGWAITSSIFEHIRREESAG